MDPAGRLTGSTSNAVHIQRLPKTSNRKATAGTAGAWPRGGQLTTTTSTARADPCPTSTLPTVAGPSGRRTSRASRASVDVVNQRFSWAGGRRPCSVSSRTPANHCDHAAASGTRSGHGAAQLAPYRMTRPHGGPADPSSAAVAGDHGSGGWSTVTVRAVPDGGHSSGSGSDDGTGRQTITSCIGPTPPFRVDPTTVAQPPLRWGLAAAGLWTTGPQQPRSGRNGRDLDGLDGHDTGFVAGRTFATMCPATGGTAVRPDHQESRS